MRKITTLAFAILILASGVFFSNARAATISDCQLLIDQAYADLAGVTIGGNHPERTRASLESKLVGASTKLGDEKYQEAFDKLVDFRTAVEDLLFAAKPKISQPDAELLISDANNALACVQSLIDGG